MLSAERQLEIVRRVEAEGSVTVTALSAHYGVTPDCIRKDLRSLEKQGLLKRTYGGAVRARVNRHALEVSERQGVNLPAKRAIAARAMQLVKPEATIFLDISTSNIELARLLQQTTTPSTIVTNMLAVADVLKRSSLERLVVTGGMFNSTRDGFTGSLTDQQIRQFRFDIAFIGAAAVDTDRGAALTYLPEDGLTKAAALSVSRTAYLLAETHKLTEDADYAYAALDDFTGIVLDKEPPAAERSRLEASGLTLLF